MSMDRMISTFMLSGINSGKSTKHLCGKATRVKDSCPTASGSAASEFHCTRPSEGPGQRLRHEKCSPPAVGKSLEEFLLCVEPTLEGSLQMPPRGGSTLRRDVLAARTKDGRSLGMLRSRNKALRLLKRRKMMKTSE